MARSEDVPVSRESALPDQYRDGRNLEARIRLHERFSTNPCGFHPWLLSQGDLAVDASILELGCGVGSFWVTNRESIPPRWRVDLTDISPGMVLEAERRLSTLFAGFTFATVDAEVLPYADTSFDAVFAHFMFYHVEDRQRAICEVARVLRPGGQLYAATNGPQHMREAREFAMNAGLMTLDEVEAGDAAAFSLENGAEQLRAAFASVERRRYEDRLVVTEAEPLMAYILSTGQAQDALSGLAPDERAHRMKMLHALLESRLSAHGHIIVTKDSGVFIAR